MFSSSSLVPLPWLLELPFQLWEPKHFVTRWRKSFHEVKRNEFQDWPIDPPQPKDVTPEPPEQSAPWQPVLEPEPSPKSSWTVISVLGTVAAVVVEEEPLRPWPWDVFIIWMIAGAPGAVLSTERKPPPLTSPRLYQWEELVYEYFIIVYYYTFVCCMQDIVWKLPENTLLPMLPFSLVLPDKHDSWSRPSVVTLSRIWTWQHSDSIPVSETYSARH